MNLDDRSIFEDMVVFDGKSEIKGRKTELLENQLIVVTDPGLESEQIYYKGVDEIAAHKRLKELNHAFKRLYRANVQMMEWRGFEDTPFILSYEVIEELA